MATIFATKTKAAIGSLLAGSILLTAVPASAQYRNDYRRDYHRDYHRDRDGISAGEVIAGAVVIGGLAAILSSNNGNYRDGYYNDRFDGRYNDGYDWRRNGGSRQAIEQCVAAVESRGGRRTDIDVTRITDVERLRGGYRIEGRVAVDYRGRGYGYNNGYGRGRYDDYRPGRDYGQRYDDRGSFSCAVRYGQVRGVDIRGI